MKFLVLVAVMLSLPATAAEPTEMYMPNDAGGYVVLTLEDCQIDRAKGEYNYRAYATESDTDAAPKHEGCWARPQHPEGLENLGEVPVNTWWGPGLMASFKQKLFTPERKRWDIIVPKITVTPENSK